jgi:hypothetical protein
MFRDLFFQMPTWFKICFVLSLVLGIAMMVFTIKECGAKKAFLLGDKAPMAIALGMCEE